MITDKDLKRAERLIEKDDPVIYDVAVNLVPNQIVGNVKHMRFFRYEVARWISGEDEMEYNW